MPCSLHDSWLSCSIVIWLFLFKLEQQLKLCKRSCASYISIVQLLLIFEPRCCLYSKTGVWSQSHRPFLLTVRWSVCLCLCSASWKTSDWIRMPFGMVGRMGPWMRDRSTGRGNCGGKYVVPHYNQWGLFTIGNSHCAAASLLLGQFLELPCTWASSSHAGFAHVRNS